MYSQNIGVFTKVKRRVCQRNLLLLAMDGSIREREETKKQEHGKYQLLEFLGRPN